MKTSENHGFLVGMTRRQNPEAETLIDRVDAKKWIDCPMGINAREKKEPPQTRVQEVQCDRQGVRVFVVDSDDRRAYEERQRTKTMERARAALERVQTRVAKGRLKQPEKIGAAVERALQKNFGYRCGSFGSPCLILLGAGGSGLGGGGAGGEVGVVSVTRLHLGYG